MFGEKANKFPRMSGLDFVYLAASGVVTSFDVIHFAARKLVGLGGYWVVTVFSVSLGYLTILVRILIFPLN